MGAKDVLRVMLLHDDEPAVFTVTPDTSIAPFWLSTSMLPLTPFKFTEENDTCALTEPLTAEAVRPPLEFSTVSEPPMRSTRTRPKLVLTHVSPPISARVTLLFPVTIR